MPGHNRNIVTLIEPRTYNVIVIREDGVDKEGHPLQGVQVQYTPLGSMLEPAKTGIAQSVELKAYENDVLHALAQSGGMPGVSAKAEIKILRARSRMPASATNISGLFRTLPSGPWWPQPMSGAWSSRCALGRTN